MVGDYLHLSSWKVTATNQSILNSSFASDPQNKTGRVLSLLIVELIYLKLVVSHYCGVFQSKSDYKIISVKNEKKIYI